MQTLRFALAALLQYGQAYGMVLQHYPLRG